MLAGAPETTAGAADHQCLPCATAHGDEVYGDFGTLGQDPLGGAIQTATATSAQPSPAEESQLVAINCRPDANQRAFLFALLVQNVASWVIPEEETGKPKLYAAYLSESPAEGRACPGCNHTETLFARAVKTEKGLYVPSWACKCHAGPKAIKGINDCTECTECIRFILDTMNDLLETWGYAGSLHWEEADAIDFMLADRGRNDRPHDHGIQHAAWTPRAHARDDGTAAECAARQCAADGGHCHASAGWLCSAAPCTTGPRTFGCTCGCTSGP
jgi:hypothetical protein